MSVSVYSSVTHKKKFIVRSRTKVPRNKYKKLKGKMQKTKQKKNLNLTSEDEESAKRVLKEF